MRGGRLVLERGCPGRTGPVLRRRRHGQEPVPQHGLPVVVSFSAGNLREVMREWRRQNPDQVMVTAGDNDHHKERLDAPEGECRGADGGAHARGDRAVPALPPFTERDPGTDWNDFEQSSGSAAVRQQIDGAITASRTAKQEQSMDGNTTLAPRPSGKVRRPRQIHVGC